MNYVELRNYKESLLTHEYVCSLFNYDRNTGILTWRVSLSLNIVVGSEAGCTTMQGYRTIRIDGKLYPTHRIIWFIRKGYFPEHEVDHKNGIRDDNRWKTLY